ncbi:hypothetical protein Gohar_027997 [Gossypium harknessii]|uniref:Uncharacterized protein n=1 Tax=Gossypium harknessii TaxID=34285 RepID=A0A7J9I6Z0_9ROSI|nr:hypothetical protein [Gossypium harknessii]
METLVGTSIGRWLLLKMLMELIYKCKNYFLSLLSCFDQTYT